VPDLDPLVKRLHARHPDYTGTRGEGLWRLLSDAAEGSGGFRAAIDTLLTLAAEDDLEEPRFQDVPRSYVVRYPRERLAAYARRVRTATYANYVAPVLREYAGHLWRKPPQRSDLPVAVAQVWADVDGAIRLYERSVGAWMSDLDRERGTSGPRGASAVHAVWAGRTEPLLALVRNGARTSRPNPARRKPARSKSGQRSGRRLP
jgi:hypothetical protein